MEVYLLKKIYIDDSGHSEIIGIYEKEKDANDEKYILNWKNAENKDLSETGHYYDIFRYPLLKKN